MFGSEAQKQKYLVPLARGEKIGAWGLTESTSGSDAAGMRTTATRVGECWVLNGSKTFTTHGRVGDSPGRRWRSPIAPPAARASRRSSSSTARRACHAGKKEDKLGMRASDTSEVLFENCRMPADQLLGEEGQGFVDTMQVLDAGRIGIAALSVGLAQGAYEAALRYAQERKAFGKTISSFQAIQWKLADNATRIEAARLLTYRAAYLKDRGDRTTLESSMAKLYASEIAVKAADDCVQIHGGYGFVKDYPAEKYLPRREADDHRRRHQRDPAAGDRPAAAGAMTVAALAERVLAGDTARHRARHLADRRRRSRRRRPGPRDLRPHRPRLPGRRHRPARRRQEHARRSAHGRTPTARSDGRRASRSIRPARSPAARCSAIGCGCRAHAADEGVFIRSMATRGHLGGLSRATGDAALVLDAAGKDVIVIETVGVGQDEVDIVRTADVSIVTLVPGTGDDVQALKAGIMEIADIFVVNKADREGADRLVSAIEANLSLHAYQPDGMAAADSQDDRDQRPGRRRGVAGDRCAFMRAPATEQSARRRSRSEYRLRELVAARFMAHLEGHVLAARRARCRWSTASPPATSIPTRRRASCSPARSVLREQASSNS